LACSGGFHYCPDESQRCKIKQNFGRNNARHCAKLLVVRWAIWDTEEKNFEDFAKFKFEKMPKFRLMF
jgi:hypothetical protein